MSAAPARHPPAALSGVLFESGIEKDKVGTELGSIDLDGTLKGLISSTGIVEPSASPTAAAQRSQIDCGPEQTQKNANSNRNNVEVSRPSITPAEVQFSLAFTRVVSVLRRSEPYRKLPLSALDVFIIPPLITGQFAVLDTDVDGQTVPVAVAFWAHVSAEIDAKLSDPSQACPPLAMQDWRSGNILWLIDAIGDGRGVSALLQQLQTTVFGGREIKMRKFAETRPPH